MSDFLFSSRKLEYENIKNIVDSIYQNKQMTLFDFSGFWGSLFVKEGFYPGYHPFQNEEWIAFVIGAPMLRFDKNSLITGYTEKILTRWLERNMDWEVDVDGPFVFGVINKMTSHFTLITDVGLYIPVYHHKGLDVVFGTHVDMVAYATESLNEIDGTSMIDFYLNGCVTFPYTIYSSITQCDPASVYDVNPLSKEVVSRMYWTFGYQEMTKNINDLAITTRNRLKEYLDHMTQQMDQVALFLSGGEDSRYILSELDPMLNVDAITFLDQMNKEGRIARRIARIFGAKFHLIQRDPYHYLKIMKESSMLVGSGVEFKHCHTYGFSNQLDLSAYPVVLGGYQADTMLKGYWLSSKRYIDKKQVSGVDLNGQFTQQYPFDLKILSDMSLQELHHRKMQYLQWNKEYTQDFVLDSFFLWPRTMGAGMVNFYCNRRLFASIEVFMSHQVLKSVYSMASDQRDGRKFYHSMAKPVFYKTRFLKNANGTWPYLYLPFEKGWIFLEKVRRKLKRMIIKSSPFEGSWCDWSRIFESNEWKQLIDHVCDSIDPQFELFNDSLENILRSRDVSPYVKLNMIQSLVHKKSLDQWR